MRAAILAGFGVVCLASTARADVELKNDGFNSGDQAAAQGGFVTGEMAASRFVAPEAGRDLLKVQLIFAGPGTDGQQRTVTLHVFDDSAGANAPGSELYSNDFTLTSSSSAIQEVATTDMQVTVPQQFRVAVEFQMDGVPSAARDTDGTIAADKNYIFAIPGGWIKSQSAGLTGDWIIRAFVSGTGGMMTGDGGMTMGGSCTGNGDCPNGQFCDTAAGACTFECRLDEDCGGGGICNSLGQCIGGDGGGGGCCRTDGGGGEAGALVGAGLLGLLVLRRRRCG